MKRCRVTGMVKRAGGAALVELAIVLSLLITLFSGMVELGRALYEYETLTKSARVAARYLSQYSPDDGNYSSSVKSAQCLAAYGSATLDSTQTKCAGTLTPVAPGLSTSNVACTQISSYPVYDKSNNDSTSSSPVGVVNFVEVKITGYNYSPIQSWFRLFGLTFGDISVVMRQS
ncbi:TadE/TadG family type IV pilus assembly protein [Trinickia sp. EG282A]|uniref:TadE/TadG family type IV pilus assembly protein n=1 Tax=Trinickia sp. EG282A TaxID=3237013 RepID=UPI0034D1D71B